MTSWISVADKLPESRTLVFIHGIFHGYDKDSEHTSIGVYVADCNYWSDMLDCFPTSHDTEVLFWQPLVWPEKPIKPNFDELADITWFGFKIILSFFAVYLAIHGYYSNW